jgi:hypothetical protein
MTPDKSDFIDVDSHQVREKTYAFCTEDDGFFGRIVAATDDALDAFIFPWVRRNVWSIAHWTIRDY